MSNVTISGVEFDFAGGGWNTFSTSFGISGGWFEAAGCDTWVMDATVSDFSLVVGGVALAEPHNFSANITRTPYPCGGQVYAGITSGPMVLQSTGDLFTAGSTITGNFGTMQIEDATWTVHRPAPDPPQPQSVPEPATLGMLIVALALAAVVARYRARHDAGGEGNVHKT